MGGEGHGADPMGVGGEGEGSIRQCIKEAAVGGSVEIQVLRAHHSPYPSLSGPRDLRLQP